MASNLENHMLLPFHSMQPPPLLFAFPVSRATMDPKLSPFYPTFSLPLPLGFINSLALDPLCFCRSNHRFVFVSIGLLLQVICLCAKVGFFKLFQVFFKFFENFWPFASFLKLLVIISGLKVLEFVEDEGGK